MKNNIPCYIVKDLLPSYIDKVLSDDSYKEVESHISECEECKKIFADMTSSDIKTEEKTHEVNLIRKVRETMNKKTKRVIITSSILCLLLAAAIYVGTTEAVAKVDPSVVTVEVVKKNLSEVEKLSEGVNKLSDGSEVEISKGSDDDEFKEIVIDNGEGKISMFITDNDFKEDEQIVSCITWKAPMFLRAILSEEVRDADGKITINVSGYKTDLYNLFIDNNKDNYFSTSSIIFGDVDEINYNGNIIWKAE